MKNTMTFIKLAYNWGLTLLIMEFKKTQKNLINVYHFLNKFFELTSPLHPNIYIIWIMKKKNYLLNKIEY